jgi:hypothetical protein
MVPPHTAWRRRIERYLTGERSLELNPRERLRPVSDGVDFLGYIVRRDYPGLPTFRPGFTTELRAQKTPWASGTCHHRSSSCKTGPCSRSRPAPVRPTSTPSSRCARGWRFSASAVPPFGMPATSRSYGSEAVQIFRRRIERAQSCRMGKATRGHLLLRWPVRWARCALPALLRTFARSLRLGTGSWRLRRRSPALPRRKKGPSRGLCGVAPDRHQARRGLRRFLSRHIPPGLSSSPASTSRQPARRATAGGLPFRGGERESFASWYVSIRQSP